MIVLTAEQVECIGNLLLKEGLNYGPVKEELLDHLCCQVEFEMQKGSSFEKATQKAFQAFKEDEFKEIQQQILKPKSSFMRKILTLLVLILIGFFFLWPDSSKSTADKMEEEALEQELPPKIIKDHYPQMQQNSSPRLAKLNEPPSIYPTDKTFEVSSGYGIRLHPVFKANKFHKGVDIKAPAGSVVYATSDGKILKTKYDTRGYGKHIIIEHDSTYQSLYAHLSEINVEEGQLVKKGMPIGKVGSTGASMAPHLHYEIIKNGKKVDPEPFIRP